MAVASFVAGALIGPSFVPALYPTLYGQYRTANTTELLRTDLGTWCEGKEVSVEIQEYGPGTSGRHVHPAHSFAWMIEGTQVKTVQGKGSVTARPGDVLWEGPMEVHETVTPGPAKALVLRILEKGQASTTRIP
jgi:quercetin dioxygenase-like cupin family protein